MPTIPANATPTAMPLAEAPRLPQETCDRLQQLVDVVDDLERHLDGLDTAALDEVSNAIRVCEASMQPVRNMAEYVHKASVDALNEFGSLIGDKLVPAIGTVTAAAHKSTDSINDMASELQPLQQQIDDSTSDLIGEVQERATQLTTAGTELHDLTRQLFAEAGAQVDALAGSAHEAEDAARRLESQIEHVLDEFAVDIDRVAVQQFVQPTQRMLDDFRTEIGLIEGHLRQLIASCGDRFAAQVTQFVDAQLAGVYAEIDATAARLEQRFGLEVTGQSEAADGSRSSTAMLEGVFREAVGKLPAVKEIGGIVGLPI